jgi:hypothetical protein
MATASELLGSVHFPTMRTRAAIMAMMLAGAASALATAGVHAAPVGYEEPQILKIEPGGAATVQSYTPEQLRSAFPMQEVETITPWSKGVKIRYRGPNLKDILAHSGMLDMPSVDAFAYDDFLTTIPMDYIEQYNPIIAVDRGCTIDDYKSKRCDNGELYTALQISDYGPYYIVWPVDKTPPSFMPDYNAVWVWYLVALRPGT